MTLGFRLSLADNRADDYNCAAQAMPPNDQAVRLAAFGFLEEQLRLAGDEGLHGLGFFGRAEATVQQPDAQPAQLARERRDSVERGLQLAFLRFLDHRADPVGLLALRAGVPDAREHLAAARVRNQARLHRPPARRLLVYQ